MLGAGPQDTLNEKGQIDIEEVESVQSHLPLSFYAEGARARRTARALRLTIG